MSAPRNPETSAQAIQIILGIVAETKGDVKDVQRRVTSLETSEAIREAESKQRRTWVRHAKTMASSLVGAVAAILGIGFIG